MLISSLLDQRVRRDGASPLITYYDLDSGERTELSATSLANWVAKTANLIVDELMLEPGQAVDLELARTHPGHWVTLIWELACWRTGLSVRVGVRGAADALVIGPDSGWASSGQPVIFCGLHPLGLPARVDPPLTDYNTEVRGQPDQFSGPAVLASMTAWSSAAGDFDQSALVATLNPRGSRKLIIPSDPWTTARQAILRPLAVGGSSVIIAGTPISVQIEHLRETERAD